MSYQHFTKQPIQLTTHNNNLFITYFRNKNQNLLLRKGCTDPATLPQGHRCHHTPSETLLSPPFDLFSHPPHQQLIRWCCTRRLRELSLLRKRGTSKSLNWKQERKFKCKLLWVRKYLCCWL